MAFFSRTEKKSEVRTSDFAFYMSLRVIALVVIFLFLGVGLYLYKQSQPLFAEKGVGALFSKEWDPSSNQFGILSFIVGTLSTSLLALLFAVPVGVGTALFLTEVAPLKMRSIFGFLIEMLAAIPSVVYGLWGVFVLAPFVRDHIQPLMPSVSFLSGPPLGIGLFTASLVLAIMILPTITSVAREIFKAVPPLAREGALALGATRWEMIRVAVIDSSYAGILAAAALGLGRALGETMAVTMVIGNRADIPSSLFSPAATMASVIANEYAEASSNLHLASLTTVGLTLFFIAIIINSVAAVVVVRARKKAGGR